MTEDRDDRVAVEAFKIGTKVSELREKNRYTLHDLAAKTGLARETLARIESHEVVPPIATLVKLAGALDVSMTYFFQDDAGSDKITVTRRDETVRISRRPHHMEGEVNYVYEVLEVKKTRKHMEPFLVEFPVQETSDMVFNSHEGEEFLHVIEGELEFRSVDYVTTLHPGDNIYFESDVSHSLRCLGGTPAKAFVVVWAKP